MRKFYENSILDENYNIRNFFKKYIPTLLLIVFWSIGLFFLDEAANVIIIKTLTVPMFMGADSFIYLYFKPAESYPRWSLANIEKQILRGLNFACLMTIFMWKPTMSAWTILGVLLLMTAFISLANLLFYRQEKAEAK